MGSFNITLLALTVKSMCTMQFLDSIVVSIPVCHTGDWGSIPCQGDDFFVCNFAYFLLKVFFVIRLQINTTTFVTHYCYLPSLLYY